MYAPLDDLGDLLHRGRVAVCSAAQDEVDGLALGQGYVGHAVEPEALYRLGDESHAVSGGHEDDERGRLADLDQGGRLEAGAGT